MRNQIIAEPESMEMGIPLRDFPEGHYRRLFDHNPLPMWIYDLETLRFVEVNKAAEIQYGFTAEEFLSMTIRDIRPSEDIAMLEENLKGTRQNPGWNCSSSWRHRRKDGSVIAVEITGFPLTWNGRSCELILARDTTRQAETECQLRDSQASLRSLLEGIEHVVWSVDKEFRFLAFNEPLRQMALDVTGNDIRVGLSVDEVMSSDEAEYWKNHYRRSFRGERFTIEQSFVVFSDVRHFRVTFTPVVVENQVTAVTAFGQDISSFKRAEKQKEQLLLNLSERIKELRAIHNTANILQHEDEPLASAFQRIVRILPGALQHSDVAAARIRYDGTDYATENFQDSPWCLRRTIATTFGRQVVLEVVYLEKRPEDNIGPFLNEENDLLISIAEMIRVFLENSHMKSALVEREQRFRSLIENSSDVIVMFNAEGALSYVSPSIQRVLGYSAEEYARGSAFDQVHPEDLTTAREAMGVILKGREMESPIEIRMRHKDGRWVWVEVAAKNKLNDPCIASIIANFRDITDRKITHLELEENREWFRTLFEVSRDGIVVEENEIMVYANRAFAEVYGYADPAELIGKHVSVIQSGEDNERMLEFGRKRLLGEPVPSLYEFKGKRKDNTPIDMEASVSVSTIAGKKYIVTILRDIRDRKAAELALEESEERYRTFFQDDLSGNFIATPAGEIIACNPAFARIFGFSSPDEAISTSAAVLYLNNGEPEEYSTLFRENRRLEGIERTMRRKDGALVHVVANVAGGFDAEDRLLYIKGYILDITQQKQATQKLEEQAALLDISRDAIIVRDLENRILFWNKGAESLYGWKKEEVQDQPLTDSFLNGAFEKFLAARTEVLRTGEWAGELNPLSKSGKKLVVESKWTLVCDGDGRPKSVLMVDTDITEKKSLEVQFLRTQRLESLGTLAGGIAHDLNNVLGPILMGAEVMKLRTNDPSTLKLLNSMETSARRGAEMVKQVLAFARGMDGERVPVHLKHLVDEITRFIEETFPKTIVIRKEIRKQLPSVLGDATQLHQVLLNLSVNARDAMPNGGVLTFELDSIVLDDHYALMHPDARPGRYVMVGVADSGTGISPSILDKIFDPFFTTKESGKGTGLGLSTVLGIVKGHGGFVNVYSEVGKGTRFRLYIPAVTVAEPDGESSEAAKNPPGNGELILVVDDEASIRDISRLTLENNGYEVVTANDGTEAIAVFMERRNDLKAVITDMSMPFMDGPSTIRALYRLDPDLPIIACSGLFTAKTDADRLGECVKGFLLKPFTASKLLLTLRSVLDCTSQENSVSSQ